MAVSYTADQLSTVARLQGICATILDQIALAKIIVTEASDNGYASGGANAITDSILQSVSASGSVPFPKLAAADVFAAALWLGNLDAALSATSITPTGTLRTGYRALERMRP